MTGAEAVDGAGFRLVLAGWLSSASSISLVLALAPFVVANVNGTSEIQEIFATFSAVCAAPLRSCCCYSLCFLSLPVVCTLFFLYLFSFTINCKIFPRGFYSELFSVHSAHRFIVRFLISHFIIHYSLVVCVVGQVY